MVGIYRFNALTKENDQNLVLQFFTPTRHTHTFFYTKGGLINLEFFFPFQHLFIFGRDVSLIPCFRNSFLYGVSSGVAIGFLTFMKTSRPAFSSNMAMGSFIAITLGYWLPCRYQYSKEQFEIRKMQALMNNASVYEGTALEKELTEKSEDA